MYNILLTIINKHLYRRSFFARRQQRGTGQRPPRRRALSWRPKKTKNPNSFSLGNKFGFRWFGYTHIRFALGDAALEWQIAEMTEASYVVRLAPMEANELSQAEMEAIGNAETLTGSYRARVTAMIEGEEVDVTNVLPSLTAIFDAGSVRTLAEGEATQLLLVPNDGEPEAQVSTVQYIEATDTEPARYEAPLTESGLFALTLQ